MIGWKRRLQVRYMWKLRNSNCNFKVFQSPGKITFIKNDFSSTWNCVIIGNMTLTNGEISEAGF